MYSKKARSVTSVQRQLPFTLDTGDAFKIALRLLRRNFLRRAIRIPTRFQPVIVLSSTVRDVAGSKPHSLIIFRNFYWGTVIALAIAVSIAVRFYAPDNIRDVFFDERQNSFGELVAVFLFVVYSIVARAFYRLILRFASHAIESDALTQEIKDSEGRIKLNINPAAQQSSSESEDAL